MSSSSSSTARKSGRPRKASQKSQDSYAASNLQGDSTPDSPVPKKVKRSATAQNTFKVNMTIFFQKKTLVKLIDDPSDSSENQVETETIDILLSDKVNMAKVTVDAKDGTLSYEDMRTAISQHIQQNPNIMPEDLKKMKI